MLVLWLEQCAIAECCSRAERVEAAAVCCCYELRLLWQNAECKRLH